MTVGYGPAVFPFGKMLAICEAFANGDAEGGVEGFQVRPQQDILAYLKGLVLDKSALCEEVSCYFDKEIFIPCARSEHRSGQLRKKFDKWRT